MWHPEPVVRHSIPAARWPTADEAGRALLFQPVRVGSVELESRTWVPAMVPWRATEDGFVTRENLEWYGRFADISDRHRRTLVHLFGDETWMSREEEEVRNFLKSGPDWLHECVLDERELESLRFGYRERVTDTHLQHVRELPAVLPGLFADAARRAREAGFDGVELHYAHAYTMASFLSRRNDRRDGYGATPEGRVRLPLEVYRAVRAEVGTDYCVGVRFLGDEVIAGGSRIDDAVYYAAEFARAGFDFLSVSKGGKFEDAKQPKVGHAVY